MDENHLDSYLKIPYVDGGRTMSGADCWGFDRLILHHYFGFPLLESFGNISPDDKIGMTNVFRQIEGDFIQSQPQDGCIAACFKRNLLVHVGVVVQAGGLHVYHTGRMHGPVKTRLSAFVPLFFEVKYYVYNTSIPKQA